MRRGLGVRTMSSKRRSTAFCRVRGRSMPWISPPASSRHGFGAQEGAEEGARAADASPLLQVLQRVHDEEDARSPGCGLGGGGGVFRGRPLRDALRGCQGCEAQPHGGLVAVDDDDRRGSVVALGEQLGGGLGGVDGAGELAADVHGDDGVSVGEGFVDGLEVADAGLRGAGQDGTLAQAGVELVFAEVDTVAVYVGPEVDVEGHDGDAIAIDVARIEVGGGVSDEADRHGSAILAGRALCGRVRA